MSKFPCMCGGCFRCGHQEASAKFHDKCEDCGMNIYSYQYRNVVEYECEGCKIRWSEDIYVDHDPDF